MSNVGSVLTILALHGAGAVFGLAGPALGLSQLSLFYLFMGSFLVYALCLDHGIWR
jgi:hypothetical protein